MHGSPLKATPASITTGEPKPGSECSFSTHLTFASLSAHGVRKIVLSVFFSYYSKVRFYFLLWFPLVLNSSNMLLQFLKENI